MDTASTGDVALDRYRIVKPLSFMVLTASLTLWGCSTEQLKGTAYETLRNIELQQCQQDNPTQCQRGESYGEYQHRLKEFGAETNQ